MSYPGVFILRELLVKQSPTDFKPTALMLQACRYRSTYPNMAAHAKGTVSDWINFTKQLPDLTDAIDEWFLKEKTRPNRPVPWLKWVERDDIVTVQSRMSAFVRNVITKDLEFHDDAIGALAQLSEINVANFLLVDQGDLLSQGWHTDPLRQIHQEIVDWIHAFGGRVTGSRMSVTPVGTTPDPLAMPSDKVRNMIRPLLRDAHINPEGSWLVVDYRPLVKAARDLGMRAMVIQTGRSKGKNVVSPDVVGATDLRTGLRYIRSALEQGEPKECQES